MTDVSLLAGVDPVFIDLETRSCCDLPKEGGDNYSTDPTTRLLTVSWSSEPDVFHLWLPGADRMPPADYCRVHLSDCIVHVGPEIPEELLAVTDRPWVAHNAWSFDQPVWEKLTGVEPETWIDTYPLALACGLPGGLNQIAQRLWGEGKYEEGQSSLKKASRCDDPALADACNVPIAQQILVGRYNVQDVRLLRWLWDELVLTYKNPKTELDVMNIHRRINDRGVRVDRNLLKNLIRLSEECRGRAVGTISELTDGFLSSMTDLNSRARVFKWLEGEGLDLGKNLQKKDKTGTWKSSLSREIVTRFVEESDSSDPEEWQQEDDGDDPPPQNLPKILKVLELRTSALRVTHGKLDAALRGLSYDDRMRFLFVYWGAHTGRWAGRRVQLQNLPKPKKEIDVWKMVELYHRGRLFYDDIADLLPKDVRFLTPDDVTSALIRCLLIPDDGEVLATADLSNIECRVLAYLAGEDWLMEKFWAGADPYITIAEKIFGPSSTWPGVDPKKGIKKHKYRDVGKIVELGSGYGLGINQFTLYAAASGIDLAKVDTDAKTCIEAYRDTHPAIAGAIAGEYNGRKYYRGGFWNRLNDAAIHCCMTNRSTSVGRVNFHRKHGHLYLELPSGRCLVYRSASIRPTVPKFLQGTGKTVDSVVYQSGRFGPVAMYPGKWAENVVQAASRDVIGFGLCNVGANGMPASFHVHDEGGASIPAAREDDFMSAFTTCPDWLPDFPLDAEGGCAPRYAKSSPPGVSERVFRNGRFYK